MRVLLLVLVAFFAEPAFASGPAPCRGASLPAPVSALAAGLETARNDASRHEIAAQAASLSWDEALSADARACAAYLAGSAHFFSSRGPNRRRAAAMALRFFLRATALAPEAMGGLQAQTRQKTAWKRLGKISGWIEGTIPRKVTVPATDENDVIILTPGSSEGWAKTCGSSAPCAEAARFELPRTVGRSLEVLLAPGSYGVKRTTRCGSATLAEPSPLTARLAIPAAPACGVKVMVRDGDDEGRVVSGWTLAKKGGSSIRPADLKADMGPVTLSLRGYRSQSLALPADGGELVVQMKRCPVSLKVRTIPPDARLEGADSAPWGRRTISAHRAGHATLRHAIEVPAPAQCTQAEHQVSLVMERNVSFTVRAEGNPVTPSLTRVNDTPVNPLGFHRPPGQYAFHLDHPSHGPVSGRFEVAACTGGHCPAVSIRVNYAPRHRPPATGSKWAMGIGGILVLGGLGTGLEAYESDVQLRTYTTKVEMGESFQEIRARRDEMATTADGLLAGGLALFTAGYLWYRSSQKPRSVRKKGASR